MNLLSPIFVTADVFQLRALGARVTCVVSGGQLAVVDAGFVGSLPLIRHGLGLAGYGLGDVSVVIATHWHPDHTGGLAELVDKTGAVVAASPEDARIIERRESLPTPHRSWLLGKVLKPGMQLTSGRPVPVSLKLQDGQDLPGMPEVTTVNTPGHTPGSISLYSVASRTLIVGDALQYRLGKLLGPAKAVTHSVGDATASIGKLARLEPERICFGHAPPLATDAAKTLRQLARETSG